MSELIDKADLFNNLATAQTMAEAYSAIQDAPEAIIRCKDCARYGREDCFLRIQMIWELRPWDFCSYAEAKHE